MPAAFIATSLLLIAAAVQPQTPASHPPAADIAGRYSLGDGLGCNEFIQILPSGRFAYLSHGCLGEYANCTGAVTQTEDQLDLPLDDPQNQKTFGVPNSLIVVRWADRIYLIPPDKLLDFCNEVNQEFEPRTRFGFARFFLRAGDADKPAPGLPGLPRQFAPLILPYPVHGTLTSNKSRRTGMISLSSKDGIYVGMVLTARDRNGRLTQLVVTALSDHDATVRAKHEDVDLLPLSATVSSQFSPNWPANQPRFSARQYTTTQPAQP